MQHETNIEDTTDLLIRQQKIDAIRTINKLSTQLANTRPDRWYTLTTITSLIAAAADWAGLAVHTTLDHSDDLSAFLGTHQVVFATINISAIVLCCGWAIWRGQIRRENLRDQIATHRHDLLMAEVRRVLADAERREVQAKNDRWKQMADEFRGTDLRAVGEPATMPPPSVDPSPVLRFRAGKQQRNS